MLRTTAATENEFESSQAAQPATPSKKLATRRKRDLTAQERIFLNERKAQKWIVHCQVTPPGYVGPKRAISYLARYVAGVAISDQRLVRDADGFIVISYKDYKNRKQTGKRLFRASGRDERLAKCRELILTAKQPNVVTESGGETPEAASFNEQTQNIVTGQDIETTREMSVQVATECQTASDQAIIDEQTTEENAIAGEADDEPPNVRTCECRYCKGEAVELGKMLRASVAIDARHNRKNNDQSSLLELFEALLLASKNTTDATTRASILGSSFK